MVAGGGGAAGGGEAAAEDIFRCYPDQRRCCQTVCGEGGERRYRSWPERSQKNWLTASKPVKEVLAKMRPLKA